MVDINVFTASMVGSALKMTGSKPSKFFTTLKIKLRY